MKKNLYLKRSILLIISAILVSCLDRVEVPTRQETTKLVVEGLFTNDPSTQQIRLSLTNNFGDVNQVSPVLSAVVEIRSKNERRSFRPAFAGQNFYVYMPDSSFAGKPGTEYWLHVTLADGRVYESAPQTMPVPVPIEALNAEFAKENQPGFRIFADFKDPATPDNYYRWTARGYHQRRSKGVPVGFGNSVCCDRCWVLKDDRGINLFSDALVNGSVVPKRPVYFSPFYVLGRHLVEVQQYSISRQTHQFWNRYNQQRQRTGTIFDPLPASLFGNVVNIKNPEDIALGYFEVSGVSKKRIEPVADTQGDIALLYESVLYVPDGDCMSNFPFSSYISTLPPGW